MRKIDFKTLLFAAAIGMVAFVSVSCTNDDTDVNVIFDSPMASVRFRGQWFLDGQVIGNGSVSIDTTKVLFDIPVARMTSAMLEILSYSNEKPTVQATVAQQQMEARFVGVSQTSKYYNLPASFITFEATVDGVACNVKLRTAEVGSVVLLQEEKHCLSMVVKIVQTSLHQSDNGMVVADSKKELILSFESDNNN